MVVALTANTLSRTRDALATTSYQQICDSLSILYLLCSRSDEYINLEARSEIDVRDAWSTSHNGENDYSARSCWIFGNRFMCIVLNGEHNSESNGRARLTANAGLGN
jgi:hypothetical protein